MTKPFYDSPYKKDRPAAGIVREINCDSYSTIKPRALSGGFTGIVQTTSPQDVHILT